MKYIKTYSIGTENQFNIFNDFYIPNVSLIENSNQIQMEEYHDYSNDYFTIVAIENCSIDVDLIINTEDGVSYSSIQYSLDGGNTWSEEYGSLEDISVSAGNKLLLKGAVKTGYRANGGDQLFHLPGGYIKSTGKYKVEGNIMSLFYGDNFSDKTTLTDDTTLYSFFANDKKIIAAHNLILPITVMPSEYALSYMFSDCTSLITSPKILPAVSLETNCYEKMFYNCKSLITVPELPATVLGGSCYSNMFENCISLTKVSSNLLPARTLIDKYGSEAYSCYEAMFWGCTSLINAPELPATTLAEYCYKNMFSDCTSLVKAPNELPAYNMTRSCYEGMFCRCTSLVKAPDLVASNPTNTYDYYASMFYGCSSLKYIKCLAESLDNGTSFWLDGVAKNGTFVACDEYTGAIFYNGGFIPSGWKIEVADESTEPGEGGGYGDDTGSGS